MIIKGVMVAIGAIAGVLARVVSTNWIKSKWTYTFPVATFIINISGSLLLGFITALHLDAYSTILLGTGFIGTYTTFSTFNVESIELQRHKHYSFFLYYVGGSYVLGIAAVFGGLWVGSFIRSLFCE
ncbi:MAG: CrcB family protein [Sporolactobacillus sp.]|jgi:CrcB protein|nr:CrcB family protein [Sporolactobacillus sp.]